MKILTQNINTSCSLESELHSCLIFFRKILSLIRENEKFFDPLKKQEEKEQKKKKSKKKTNDERVNNKSRNKKEPKQQQPRGHRSVLLD